MNRAVVILFILACVCFVPTGLIVLEALVYRLIFQGKVHPVSLGVYDEHMEGCRTPSTFTALSLLTGILFLGAAVLIAAR